MRQPLVCPEGLFSWAELEVMQSALRVFAFSLEKEEGIPAEFIEFVMQLEYKLLQERGLLYGDGKGLQAHRDIVMFMGPSEREGDVEAMVTSSRLHWIQRHPDYLEWALQRNLLPYMREQMEALKTAALAAKEQQEYQELQQNGNGTS